MADFSTEAELSIVVPRRELRSARQEVEDALAEVPVGMSASGGAGGGGTNAAREQRRRRREFRWARQRTDDTEAQLEVLENIEGELTEGGLGGGGGIFGDLLGLGGEGAGIATDLGTSVVDAVAPALGSLVGTAIGQRAGGGGDGGGGGSRQITVSVDRPEWVPLQADRPEWVPLEVEDPGDGILPDIDLPELPDFPDPPDIDFAPPPGPIGVETPPPLAIEDPPMLQVEKPEWVPIQVELPDRDPGPRVTTGYQTYSAQNTPADTRGRGESAIETIYDEALFGATGGAIAGGIAGSFAGGIGALPGTAIGAGVGGIVGGARGAAQVFTDDSGGRAPTRNRGGGSRSAAPSGITASTGAVNVTMNVDVQSAVQQAVEQVRREQERQRQELRRDLESEISDLRRQIQSGGRSGIGGSVR